MIGLSGPGCLFVLTITVIALIFLAIIIIVILLVLLVITSAKRSWATAGCKRTDRKGLSVEDDMTDAAPANVTADAARIAASILHAAGWKRSDMSPFIFGFATETFLAENHVEGRG